MKITDTHYDEFLAAAHKAGAEHLMLCSSGNMSCRLGDKVLMSGTGTWLPNIRKENIALLNMLTAESENGVKPSMEHVFHLGVLRMRPDMNVVLHFQSEYATTIACMKNKPTDYNVTAEIPCHVGREIPVIPYFRPGSPELADAVITAMKEHDACLLSSHGQVVCGKDYNDAFEKAMFFEMACRIIIQSGNNCNVLNHSEIRDLDKYVLGKITE
ncbi:MAG: class II aldolase/adducin family protein [Bacteroidales bacterium]